MSLPLTKLYKYAPRLVLEHLVEHPEPPDHPVAENIIGATLFADMAGFTSLTEKIMQISSNGLIELADIVNLYLSRQIDIIDEFGGDILKFAGDALIAMWPAHSEQELASMALRASHCGLELQRRLDRTRIGSGMELSLRIGVGAGPLLAQMVGGLYERWEFLIGGDAVDQVGRAQKVAEPGQVVISPEASRLIRSIDAGRRHANRFRIEHRTEAEAPGSLQIPDLDPDCEKALRCFIPRRIINLIEEGREGSSVFEVRTVTVLFIRILEWNTAELPIEEVHKVMRKVQAGLYRHEGAINRFGIEEKGTVILAAFGLPPLNHDDDAVRAMLSARDIILDLGEMGHRAVIGMGTGVVFVGPMGNEIRSEYTMHGNVVNLAARFMQASDSIFCDQATYERVLNLSEGDPVAAHNLKFEALEPMKVKGNDQPVRAFRLQID